MKRTTLTRRAASAALAACMMFTLSAPALAAAPALPEFSGTAKVLEQTNGLVTEDSNKNCTIDLSAVDSASNSITIENMGTGSSYYKVTCGGQTYEDLNTVTITGSVPASVTDFQLNINSTRQGVAVTLNNASISTSQRYAINVTGYIEITANGTNTVKGYLGGIMASEGSLSISGDLTAESTNANYGDYAAIYCYNSSLTINSGNVTAATKGAYGIYSKSSGGTVTINGGTVKATGVTYGIYAYDSVKIITGDVTATATGSGETYGIGSHSGVSVEGGKVTATGKNAGIYGYSDVSIKGGIVTAKATGYSNAYSINCGMGVTSITGGDVKAENGIRGRNGIIVKGDAKVKTSALEKSFYTIDLQENAKVCLTRKPDLNGISTTGLTTGWLAYASSSGYTCIAPENGKLPSNFDPDDFSTYGTADVVPSSEYDLANGAISIVVTGEKTYRVTQNGTTTNNVPGPLTITGTAPSTLDSNAVYIDSPSETTAQIILKDVNVTSSKNALQSNYALELTLEGENNLTTTGSNSSGLFAARTLTITGSGKLNASAPANGKGYGIYSWGINTIENTTVTATGGIYGIYNVEDLILKNSTVNAAGYNRGISSGSKVRITGGEVEAKATDPNTEDSYGIFGATGVTIDGGAEVTVNEPATTSTHGIYGSSSGVSITGSSTVKAYGKEYGIRSNNSSTVSIKNSTVDAIATSAGSNTVPTFGIYGYNGVTIENSNVTANDPNTLGQYGIYGGSATVKISGGTVKVNASQYGIYAYDDVTISDGSDGASVTVNEDVQDGAYIQDISSFGTVNITGSTVKVSGAISGTNSTNVTKSSVKADSIGATQSTNITDSNVKAGSVFGRDIDLIGSSKVLLGQKPNSMYSTVITSKLAEDGSGWLAYPNTDGEITCVVPVGYELPEGIDKQEPEQFGAATKPKQEHTPGDDLDFDANEHWYTCTDCGEEIREAHVPGDWQSAGDGHVRYCAVCGSQIESTRGEHEPGEWEIVEGEHYRECKVCHAELDYGPHVYDEETGKCVCGAVKHEHTPNTTGWGYDGMNHWRTCTECGQKVDSTVEAHTFVDGVCAVCGYAPQSPDQPGDDDIITPAAGGSDAGGAVAAVAIGGAAIWGGYEVTTRVILHNILPEGAAIPANRGQLALLVWNTAGRPEPAGTPAFADVADPDMAKAAQWCTEQGILDAKGADTFKPESWTPKFKVIEVWNKAFPKQ